MWLTSVYRVGGRMVLRALKRRVKSSQKTSWNPRRGESAPWTSTSAQGHQASCHENKDCIFTFCKKRCLILKSTLSSNFGSVCKFYFWLQFLLPKVGSSKTNRANCILPGLASSRPETAKKAAKQPRRPAAGDRRPAVVRPRDRPPQSSILQTLTCPG